MLIGFAAVGLVACSSGEGLDLSGPERGGTPDQVVAVTVDAEQTWGHGRATWAARGLDATSIVTTTGAFVAREGESPSLLGRFSTPLRVTAAAVDPTGATLTVATSEPPQVRIFDQTTGDIVSEHELPVGLTVRDLVYTGGGPGVLVADTPAGPLVWANGLDSDPLYPVETLPTGRTAILADGTYVIPLQGTADLVVLRDGERQDHTLDLDAGTTVLDASASASGRLAVSVAVGDGPFDREDQILILDPISFERQATIESKTLLDPSSWVVTDVGVAVWNGQALALWSYDGPIPVGESPTDRPVVSVHEVSGALLSVHGDGTLVRWPADSWTPIVIASGGIALEHLSVGDGGATVTSVDFYGRVTTRSAIDGGVIADDDRFAVGELTAVAVSADGSRVGVASSTGQISVLDRDLTEQWATTASSGGGRVGTIAFDPATNVVAAGVAERVGDIAFDDTVAFWDPAASAERFNIGGEAEDVAGCAFYYSRVRYSRDGSLVAVTSHDYSVFVLDATTGAVLHELPGTTTVLDLAFSPDDDLFVATYDDSTVNVWSTSDFSVVATYQGAMGGYFGIGVLADSATMVATDIIGAISVVDLMTGQMVGSLQGAEHRTSTIAVSPDGSLVAAPTADAGIALWASSSGLQLTTVTGHTAQVTGLAFAPDGSSLVSASSDGTVRTWSVTATVQPK